MLSYKQYYRFSSVFLPKLTFEKSTKHTNLLAFLAENDIENPPHAFKKFLGKDSHITKDLKSLKSAWLYGLPDSENFNRSLILYSKIDETKPDYRKTLHGLGSKAIRTLLSHKINDVDIYFSNQISIDNMALIINALLLTNYKFEKKHIANINDNHNDENGNNGNGNSKLFNPISNIRIINPEITNLNDYPEFLVNTSQYSLLARNLVNERPNISNTLYMIEKAKEISKSSPNITITTLIGEELKEKGLNLLYSVGKGSANPPALVCLKYEGDPNNKDKIIGLIGKGIVYDAGGLNLKPSGSLEDMYIDKAGACTVLATLKGIAEMKLPINVVTTIALAENFLGQNCYRPSDIITSLKGLTVEIGNTDAEGRLILADAMTWTQMNHKLDCMIELSTLTGACKIALGEQMAGLFSNNDKLANNIQKLGHLVNEPFWRLPITDEHRDSMKAIHADLNNMGKSRYGGASKAAAFLENFVEKGVKWAHLDIAGPADVTSDKGIYAAGGTGFGVRLLLHYLRERSLVDKAMHIEKEDNQQGFCLFCGIS